MALLVQKYGGTSVADLKRIDAVATRVAQSFLSGHQVVVVVSAMAGETDRLIGLAQQIDAEPNPREYAALVATGEQVAMTLLAIALNAKGVQAVSLAGWQVPITTSDDYRKARINHVETARLQALLAEGIIPIVAGFQGVTVDQNITTLGRGGSDTSAVALAAALHADECQIYTDVDGVYTTDPRVVPEARRLDRITFEEMLELASLGAKVLQIRAVEFAGKYNVPLRVLSSFNDEARGTLITYEEATVEHPIVSGIAFNRSEAKLTVQGVPDSPGIAAHILNKVSAQQIDIDMIVQNSARDGRTDFTFTVHRDDYLQTKKLLESIAIELEAFGVMGDNKIAKISLVGVGMRSHAGIASRMFMALGAEGINIQLIATSEIKVSVVVDEKYLELGVRALHTAFGLDAEPVEEKDPLGN